MIDDVLREVAHLRALGRLPFGKPSEREDLIAHMLEPSAWSKHADEHIAHATHYGILGRSNHYGTMFAAMREIAHVRAREILDALERQAEGLPPLVRFDARREGDALAARLEIRYDYQKRSGIGRSVMNVGTLGCLNGLPMPDIDADGDDVLLVWNERRCRAMVRIHGDFRISGDLDRRPRGFAPWEDSLFSKAVPTLVSHLIRKAAGANASPANKAAA